MPFGLGYVYSGWDRRKPLPAIIAELWTEDCDKKGIQTIYSLTRVAFLMSF
jgi:hypothetical protein